MALDQKCRKLLFRSYFYWQKRIAPQLRDSQYVYIDKLLTTVDGNSRWLDLGCGHRIVPAWTGFNEKQISSHGKFIVGVDRDAESLKRHESLHARVVADIDALPFREGSFNLVTANMVVEHLDRPEKNLQEIRMVLRPGGRFIFHTVNILHYNARISSLLPQGLKVRLVRFFENRKEEDVYATHYRLNTLASIHRGALDIGFDIEELNMLNSSPETIMLGPIVLLELLAIRILDRPGLANWRSNVIAILRRPASEGELSGYVTGERSLVKQES